jgi:glycosyltransferase involved in cell wall biosynthesis
MSPLVSIIIPCFNAEQWIEHAVESALSQTWTEIEIIAVNDGSTDKSLAVLARLAGPKVTVVDQPNRGASSARNAGLLRARGQFIQFLDADDLLSPTKIGNQVRQLLVAGPKAVSTARWARFQDDPKTAIVAENSLFQDLDPVAFMIANIRSGQMIHPAAWLIPMEIAQIAGPWDESLSLNDDGEYFSRVVLAATRVVHSRESLSLYRSGLPRSLSGRNDKKALVSLFASCELVARHLKEAEDSPRVRGAVADYFQRVSYELYPGSPELSARARSIAEQNGGSRVSPSMGWKERWLSRLLGWKLSRRLVRLIRK